MVRSVPEPPEDLPGRRVADVSADVLADLVQSAARRLRKATVAELAPLGITQAQVRLLRLLARADAPMRMGDLAEGLGVVPRSVTSFVDGLERAGVVRRAADPHDRRATVVELTAHGEHLRGEVTQARRRAAAAVLRPLRTAAERAELARLLSLVTAAG